MQGETKQVSEPTGKTGEFLWLHEATKYVYIGTYMYRSYTRLEKKAQLRVVAALYMWITDVYMYEINGTQKKVLRKKITRKKFPWKKILEKGRLEKKFPIKNLLKRIRAEKRSPGKKSLD